MLKVMMSNSNNSKSASQSSQSITESKCSKCHKSTRNKDVINCTGRCNGIFDVSCAGLAVSVFGEMTKLNKSTSKNKPSVNWKCAQCTNESQDNQLINISGSIDDFSNRLNDCFDGFLAKLENKVEEILRTKLQVIEDKFDAKLKSFDEKFVLHKNQMDLLERKFNEQIKKLEDRLNVIEQKPDDVQTEGCIKSLEKKCDDLQNTFEAKLMSLNQVNDRAERDKNIMIYGVPNSVAADVQEVVHKICAKYDETFDGTNVSCFRLKAAQGAAPPVIAKFSSKKARDAVFFGYLKNIKENKLKLKDVLNTGDIDLETRIFLNEHLSKHEAEVMKECRSLKKANKIQRYFIRTGNIFVGLTVNTKERIGPIMSVAHLNNAVK